MRLFVIAILTCLSMLPARAQGPGQFSSVELAGVGHIAESDGLWAMLTMQIADGWKTYWRNPGDAGIPPRFDWTGSVNLKSAEVVWPAPKRFFDGYSHSIGYKGPEVVLPLRIEAENPDRPVVLSLLLDYAVCEKICIPERAELSGFVKPEPANGEAAVLVAALSSVPGEAAAHEPGVTGAVLSADGQTLAVSLKNAADLDELELFGEGPSEEPLLLPARRSPETPVVFNLPLQGVPDEGRVKGASYRFTIVWNGGAVEERAKID